MVVKLNQFSQKRKITQPAAESKCIFHFIINKIHNSFYAGIDILPDGVQLNFLESGVSHNFWNQSKTYKLFNCPIIDTVYVYMMMNIGHSACTCVLYYKEQHLSLIYTDESIIDG